MQDIIDICYPHATDVSSLFSWFLVRDTVHYQYGQTTLNMAHPESMYPVEYPANKARVFTSLACVNLVENWCKEYFRVLSVFFNRQLLVFTEKHILVTFNIYIIFSILDINNCLCLGDINVL